jgi:adenylyltransferase/sulfurtransferase
LSDAQVERYARHILLREVGGRGQARLLGGAVRLTGSGRAAEEAAAYVVAAGVGRIGLEAALGARLGEHLHAMNPDVAIVAADEVGEHAAVVAAAGEDREAGALAALEALLVLAGVRETRAWEVGA